MGVHFSYNRSRGLNMLIEIETKANMSEKALQILEDLKDLLFESINVKDEAFLAKQAELQRKYDQARKDHSSLLTHEDVWNAIEKHDSGH